AYLVGIDLGNTASIFFLIWALGMLVARLFAGRIQDRHGANYVIPLALALIILCLIMIGFATSLPQFALAALFGGVGHGAVLPGLQVVSIQRTTPARAPTAISTHYLAMDLGIAVGPPMLGFMIDLT